MPELPAPVANGRFHQPADGVIVRGGVINLPAYFNHNEASLNKQLLQSYKVTGAHRQSEAVLPEVKKSKTRAVYQQITPIHVFKGKSSSIKSNKSPAHENKNSHVIRDDGIGPTRKTH